MKPSYSVYDRLKDTEAQREAARREGSLLGDGLRICAGMVAFGFVVGLATVAAVVPFGLAYAFLIWLIR